MRTVSGPSKKDGLKKDEYVRYCSLNGKTYRGEKKKKKESSMAITVNSMLSQLSGVAWAIQPETLEQMISQLWSTSDNQIDEKAFLDFSFELQPKVENGNGILKITGPMTKESSFMNFFFGGTSYAEIQTALEKLEADPKVKNIILDIDSPGGMVSGIHSLTSYMSSLKKPIYAWTDGNMTSAAYWIGSTAKAVYAAPTSTVGSIGVVATHTDLSQMMKNFGVKQTYITGGKYKAIGNSSEPLSQEGFEYLKELIEDSYDVFVKAIAKNRGLSIDSKDSWAEGRLFKANKANGLVDKVTTFTDFIGGEKMEITKEYLQENHKELLEEITGEIFKAEKEGFETEKAKLEQERDQALASLEEANPPDPLANVPEELKQSFKDQQAKIEALEKTNIEKDLEVIAGAENRDKVMKFYGKVSTEELVGLAKEFAHFQYIINDMGQKISAQDQGGDLNEDQEDKAIAELAKKEGITLTEATVQYYKNQ